MHGAFVESVNNHIRTAYQKIKTLASTKTYKKASGSKKIVFNKALEKGISFDLSYLAIYRLLCTLFSV